MTRDLAILIFDDVEVLDFCGPFEVFSLCNRFTPEPAFHVRLVAPALDPIQTRGGMTVTPHATIADVPAPHVLLVPGGYGTRPLLNNAAVIDWVRSATSELILSVCTGSLILGKAGLLDGLEATTHHTAIDLLRQTAPAALVSPGRRFVDNGRIVCAAGIAAGIDMSLHVVGRILGQNVAIQTAAHMEYPLG